MKNIGIYEKTLILQGLQLQVETTTQAIEAYKEKALNSKTTFGTLVDEGKILDSNVHLLYDLNELFGKIVEGGIYYGK